MKKLLIFFCACITLAACTYNLPPDSNSKIIENNLALANSSKNLKALKKALQSSDDNRTREYIILQTHIDSSTLALALKINATNDSIVKINAQIQDKQLKILNKMNDIQVILYILLIIIVILASCAYIHFRKVGNLKLEPKKTE